MLLDMFLPFIAIFFVKNVCVNIIFRIFVAGIYH